MRKPSRKTLKAKLDKICSEIVRKRGRCQICGKKKNLQCAHIFGRRFLNTRWDLDNLLCLCPNCHINLAHQKPLLFAEFVRNILGEEKYNLLKESHYQLYKPSIFDLEIKLDVLKKMVGACGVVT